MAVWNILLGVRKDLRLRRKWWHHAAIGFAVLSAVIVYLMVGSLVARRPIPWRGDNTFSLSLLNHAAGRQTTTTIADLDAILGIVAQSDSSGKLSALPRNKTDTIRCESVAKYTLNEKRTVDGIVYRSIPDYKDQPDTELRHCLAAPLYASLTASSVAVYVPDGSERRKQTARGVVAGIGATIAWLFLYWNVYYRGLVPIYARRRELRRRRRFEEYSSAR
jgi:hypothetical protein